MLKTAAAMALMMFAAELSAADFRGSFNYRMGESKYNDDSGNELTTDTSGTDIAGIFYFDSDGPFLGIGFGKAKSSNTEAVYNGVQYVFLDADADVTNFQAGYRFGNRGTPQFVASVALSRIDGDGSDTNNKTLNFGFEHELEGGRTNFGAEYADLEHGHIFAIDGGGTKYLTDSFGLSAGAGYGFGKDEVFGIDADATGWTIHLGLEFRFNLNGPSSGTSPAIPPTATSVSESHSYSPAPPAPAPLAPAAPPPVVIYPQPQQNLVALMGSCQASLASANIPASCSTTTKGSVVSMTIAFGSPSLANTHAPSAQYRLLENFCTASQQADMRGEFRIEDSSSGVSTTFDCASRSWSSWH